MFKMIKAIIIDDEPLCVRNLSAMLNRYCPDITLIDTAHSGEQGLKCINKLKPDLVFLDVEMPVLNGFDMLSKLEQVDFDLIFTTSYDEYALRAIKVNAIDYLLKPVDREDLIKAVEKVKNKVPGQQLSHQIKNLLQEFHSPDTSSLKVALPSSEGLQFVAVENIISCESEDNYTRINLRNKQKMLICVTLGDVEQMLHFGNFIRVHRSFLVNKKEIEKFIRKDGGYLVMSDGSSVPVSRYKKEELIKMLTGSK
jgi:two-component system, LytTR family, response regulator